MVTWILSFAVVAALTALFWYLGQRRRARMLARGESTSPRTWLIFCILMVGAAVFSAAAFLLLDHDLMDLLGVGIFGTAAALLWRAYRIQRAQNR